MHTNHTNEALEKMGAEVLPEGQKQKVMIINGQELPAEGRLADKVEAIFVSADNAPLLAHELKPDAIVYFFDHKFVKKGLGDLREFARKNSTPIILYSRDFDQDALLMARKGRFDDYYYGTIAESLLNKFKIIRKTKEMQEYKLKHNHIYAVSHAIRQNTRARSIRRLLDILVSASVLLVLSPLLILIAVVIKLESKGPIFYVSQRAGKNYRIFNFYKFRSMRTGADAELKELSKQNQYGDSAFVKIKNDPRVTRLGKFLRKTSLDEIPQLINVLKGDMSLVGNRPLPLYEAEALTKDYTAGRFLAPAGVTGLWQVTKRGKDEMSEDERIQLDIEYAKKNNLRYDVKLLVSTVPALVQKEAV